MGCLISDEHSNNLVWKDDPKYVVEDDNEEKEPLKVYDRLFTFSVKQTNEEEETAVAKKGFSVMHTHSLPSINAKSQADPSSIYHLLPGTSPRISV
jgi:hypothetical protein